MAILVIAEHDNAALKAASFTTVACAAKIGAQLGNILGYIEKLKQVDVTGVEPTAHAFPLVNVTRPDEVRPSISNEDALRNAPAQVNGLFIVPKIVE